MYNQFFEYSGSAVLIPDDSLVIGQSVLAFLYLGGFPKGEARISGVLQKMLSPGFKKIKRAYPRVKWWLLIDMNNLCRRKTVEERG